MRTLVHLALVLMLAAAPAWAWDDPNRHDYRTARLALALQRIEQHVRIQRQDLKHPPDRNYTLEFDVEDFRRDFPEYSDDLDRYLAAAPPWYAFHREAM